jgi:GNAT superfamily N-acetyltransferase
MYLAYLKERYRESDFLPAKLEDIAAGFEALWHKVGALILKTSFGFVTYKLEGDALIIFDMYVKPEHRTQRKARLLHDVLIELAQKNSKRVAITFVDFVGQNNLPGIEAIASVGFIPTQSFDNSQMFIKGI